MEIGKFINSFGLFINDMYKVLNNIIPIEAKIGIFHLSLKLIQGFENIENIREINKRAKPNDGIDGKKKKPNKNIFSPGLYK